MTSASTSASTSTSTSASTSASTSSGPTVRGAASSARGPVLVVLALVLVTLVGVALTNVGPGGRLDPDSYAPAGSRALAEVLDDLDVPVERVDDVGALLDGAGARTTLVVPEPSALVRSELARIGAAPGSLVVVGADDDALEALGLPASGEDFLDRQTRRPACELPAAIAAGSLEIGGASYSASSGARATGCYSSAGASPLLQLERRGAVLLGDGYPLTNDGIDEPGNAVLALSLLGAPQGQGAEQVRWLVPSPDREVPPDERGSLTELLPPGLGWGTLQLAVALAALALWRARRLGRVVEEPLPVVVRAAEAVEGRGRLYRAAGAQGSAAESLRAASRQRLVRRLGLEAGSRRPVVVTAVHARVGGDPAQIERLLYGDAPGDDDALVRLADRLRTLEKTISGEATGP